VHSMKLPKALSLLTGVFILVFSLGLFFGLPTFRQLWIWPESPHLGLAFAGSWLAGVAAPLIWIGINGQLRAIQAGTLGGVVAFGGGSVLLWSAHNQSDNERFLYFAIVFSLIALCAFVGLLWSSRLHTNGDKETPLTIRWTFLVFATILLPVGAGMALNTQGIFPAQLSPVMTRLYGWFFLGSFVYFSYGFLKPTWLNTSGHMLSFLVYDLLLIPVFLRYWPQVPDEFRLSLTVYLIILIASALFCIYYLFFNRRTRLLSFTRSFT
jgi:hypothetical protein